MVAQGFGLAFEDAELEREYRRKFSREAHGRHLIAWGLLAAATVALTAIDWIVIEPQHLHRIVVMRFAGVLPFLVLVALFGLVTSRTYLAWGHWVSVIGCAGGLLAVGAICLALSPLAPASVHYATMITSLCVLITNAAGLVRFRWATVAISIGSVGVLVALHLAGAPWKLVVYGAFFIIAAVVFGAMIAFTLERHRRRDFLQQRTIDEERAKSDRLLHNMLPAAIAERLKGQPGAIADGFDSVTVLFADIVGFTPLSESMPPVDLVRLLNQVFSAFDQMAARLGLEKIKTIGDAYMVVGGLPLPRADHAAAVATMAIEMRDVVAGIDARLALRIGLHSGPVVAGVIGASKYSYDLWGDTVNTASRMESHGAPGRIHLSEQCRAALAETFEVEERGAIEIKGKGAMRTFWLKERREAPAGAGSSARGSASQG